MKIHFEIPFVLFWLLIVLILSAVAIWGIAMYVKGESDAYKRMKQEAKRFSPFTEKN